MPVSGAWRLSFSMQSSVDSGERNDAYLFINGEALDETRHYTRSSTDFARSTGGRVVTMEASAGDKIEIRAAEMDNVYYGTLYCAEFIPKM